MVNRSASMHKQPTARGGVSRSVGLCGVFWRCLACFGSLRRVAACGGVGWCGVGCSGWGSAQWHGVALGGVGGVGCTVVCGGVWWCALIALVCGGMWWYVVVCGGMW